MCVWYWCTRGCGWQGHLAFAHLVLAKTKAFPFCKQPRDTLNTPFHDGHLDSSNLPRADGLAHCRLPALWRGTAACELKRRHSAESSRLGSHLSERHTHTCVLILAASEPLATCAISHRKLSLFIKADLYKVA